MITIITHPSPDGDAIGSSLGLLWFLKSKGNVDAKVVIPDRLPDNLKFIPGQEFVLDWALTDSKKEIQDRIANSERIYILDFNSFERIGDLGKIVEASKAQKVMIDHHQEPKKIADITISDTSASSTAELVYDYIDLTDKTKFAKEIAIALYCGIMTDTGSFRFPNTSPKVHRIIAHLLELGANHSEIHDNIYATFSKERLKMVGYIINNNLILGDDWAIIYISDEEKKKFNYQKGDTEGLVNHPLSILGMRRVAFISEDNGLVKLSLRSKGDYDVNQICKKYFHGGGHKNAAGGRSDETLMNTVKTVEKVFQNT